MQTRLPQQSFLSACKVNMTPQLPPYVTESITDTLKREEIEDYSLSPEGTTDVGDGYVTDIFFVEVTGKKGGKNLELQLAVKVEKNVKALGDPKLVKRYSERESRVYREIFVGLTNQFGTSIPYVPKCYNTFIKEGRFIIVFENLRKRNFILHDRLVPMNRQHIESVLSCYAHFHAFSFAMRDQQPEKFLKLTRDYDSIYLVMYETEFGKLFDVGPKKSVDILKGLDAGLGAKFERTIERGAKEILVDLLREELEECVITHGDAWNNNFLFRYEDGTNETPSEVMVMDWQISSLQSPTIDLIHFLFLSSSTEQVEQFDEFLKFYHDNLSRNISKLGSDPEKLFPYDLFRKHWKKYSIYGLLNASCILEPLLSDPDTFQFDEYENGDDFVGALVGNNSKYQDRVNERLLALAKYYYEINN